MAGRLLALCIASLAQCARCLRVPAPRSANSTDDGHQRAPWAFVPGWVRAATAEYVAPHRAEPGHALVSARRAGIMFITAVNPTLLDKAAEVQNSWTRYLDADDHVVNVAEPDCKEDAALDSVVVMPSDWLSDKTPYQRAQLKHTFGTVYVARELEGRGMAVWPEWWLLKDDDTYVNTFNLKAALATYDPSKPLLVGSSSGPYFFGGSGIALSWQLVEQLVAKDHGQRFLSDRANNVSEGRVYWDYYMPRAIQERFVRDAELVNDAHFENDILSCGAPLVHRRGGERNDTWCHAIPGLCTCAKSDAPAMWHMRGFPHEHQYRLEQLEAYENRTRKGDDQR